MTKSNLDRLRELDKEATPGPWAEWFVHTAPQEMPDGTMKNLIHASAPPHVLNLEDDSLTKAAKDAELIALMRNNIRALIDVAKAAENVRDGYNVFIGDGMTKLEEALSKLNGGDE